MLENSASSLQIASTLIPIQGFNVLIPNACIYEIFTLSSREPNSQSPCWHLGITENKGQQVHLLSLENIEQEPINPGRAHRIAIQVNKPRKYQDKPALAFVASDIPHLTVADSHSLNMEYRPEKPHTLALSYVKIKEKQAFIPDLERLFRDYSSFR